MLSLFFTVTLLELFLGGGGRLIEFGPVTLRMVLFGICVCIGWLAVLYPGKRIPGMRLALVLVLIYLAIHLVSVTVGIVNGALFDDIMKEFQQSLYWLAAPFFAAVLASVRLVKRTATLVQVAGLILAIAYLAILAVAFITRSGEVFELVAYLFDQGELFSRGGGLLFYKGFLYLSVALVFLVAIRGRWWLGVSTVVLAALVLSLTRGLIISTSLAILLLLFVQRRTSALILALAMAIFVTFLVWVYLPSANETLGSAREVSNQQRLDDMDYMAHYATLRTVLVGEGYGTLVDYRMGIENTFLWALWKLGIVGLAFWILPLVLCVRYFTAIRDGPRDRIACGFLCGTILVYLQTMTNPYLNNPIGLSFVMMSIFSLRTLAVQSALNDARASPASIPYSGATLS